MSASAGQAFVRLASPWRLILESLCISQAVAGVGKRLKTLPGDCLPAFFAAPERSLLDSLQGVIDFVKDLVVFFQEGKINLFLIGVRPQVRRMSGHVGETAAGLASSGL